MGTAFIYTEIALRLTEVSKATLKDIFELVGLHSKQVRYKVLGNKHLHKSLIRNAIKSYKHTDI